MPIRRKLFFGIIFLTTTQLIIIALYINILENVKPLYSKKELKEETLRTRNTSSQLPTQHGDISRDTTLFHVLKSTSSRRKLARNTVVPTLPLLKGLSSSLKDRLSDKLKLNISNLLPSLKKSISTFETIARILSVKATKSTSSITTRRIEELRQGNKSAQTTRPSKIDTPQISHTSKNSKHLENHVKTKSVLIYTPYFGKIPWPYIAFEAGRFFQENNGSRCAKNCQITYSKSMLAKSDAVIFHGNDMSSVDVQSLTRFRTKAQRWVYLALENPFHSATSPSYNGIFNWTSTYRRDSDVYMPYNNYKRITPKEIPEGHFSRNYAQGKTRLVAWAVAHCGTDRDIIVQKLLKYIDVTVYGSCSASFNQNNANGCPRGTQQCSNILKTFKFYLSFENALCKDYITEKYWETPLEHEMVPIVFGSNYDSKNAIPGSYINVLDFQSIESLANYLKYLDKNDTAYNEYFQWKSKFKVQNHSWRCMLCEKLHNQALPPKVYEDFGAFWSSGTNCNDGQIAKKFQALVNS